MRSKPKRFLVNREHSAVAQVMHQDDDFVYLKVSKRDDVSFDLGERVEANQFYTVIFVRQAPSGRLESWTPPFEDS